MERVLFGQFLILKVSRDAVLYWGGTGECDHCLARPEEGYYIAVLNEWLCEKCFNKWKTYAVYYEDDAPIERRNFDFYCMKIREYEQEKYLLEKLAKKQAREGEESNR